MTNYTNATIRGTLAAAALTLITVGCGTESSAPRPTQGDIGTKTFDPTALSTANARIERPNLYGKGIYDGGVSGSGNPIVAVLNENVEVPASAVPCASCHGVDGRGNAEGGLTASDIRWDSLTKPYGVLEAGGRSHRPYDDASLRRAVTMGFDSSGHVLQPGMPRYRLSHRDLDDLIHYLKQLGRSGDPGVTDHAVRIGVVLPPGSTDEISRAAREVMTAYFEDISSGGGIYDRKVELCFCASPAAEPLKAFYEREQPFALVGLPVSEADDETAAFDFLTDVPLIVPMSQLTDNHRRVFYLTGGFDFQARGLVGFAQKLGLIADKKIGIVTGENSVERKVADLVAGELRRLGADPLQIPMERFGMPQIALQMRQEGVEVAFCLVTGKGAGPLLRAADQISWKPIILTLGANLLDIVDSPPEFSGKLYVAVPYQPTDRTPDGLQEYRQLAARHGLTSSHDRIQFTYLACAKILTDGLREAGRSLTRETLITALERPGGFSTGLMPPVNYSNGRRVGAPDITIIEVQLATRECHTVDVLHSLSGFGSPAIEEENSIMPTNSDGSARSTRSP